MSVSTWTKCFKNDSGKTKKDIHFTFHDGAGHAVPVEILEAYVKTEPNNQDEIPRPFRFQSSSNDSSQWSFGDVRNDIQNGEHVCIKVKSNYCPIKVDVSWTDTWGDGSIPVQPVPDGGATDVTLPCFDEL